MTHKHQRLEAFNKTSSPAAKTQLLEFGLSAGFHQLLDSGFSVSLGNAFLDVLGRAVHQILGFLQAQTGDFTHGLDDGHLVGASVGQNHVEFGLLFRSSGSGATSANIAYDKNGDLNEVAVTIYTVKGGKWEEVKTIVDSAK